MPDLTLKDISNESYISSPSNTLKILKKYNIRLKKSLGQNFLIDTNILKKIARYSEITKNDCILEIGSGIGSLTGILIRLANKIICIEIDKRLTSIFKYIFGKQMGSIIHLLEKDAMKVDYNRLSGKYGIDKIVSNLPYKIAAPLIIKLLVEAKKIEKMYFTIQEDIADRLLADVGDSNYSSYTVKANYLGNFKVLFKIGRNCFYPSPFVDSVFLVVKRKDDIKANKNLKAIYGFFNFIDACFIHRRKKLVNSIMASGNRTLVDKIDLIIKMLHGIGKDAKIRAENLNLEEFLYLYNSISDEKK